MKIKELLEGSAADSFLKAVDSGNQNTVASQQSKLQSFRNKIKTAYKQTGNFTDNLPYSKTGKMFQKFSNWAKKINK